MNKVSKLINEKKSSDKGKKSHIHYEFQDFAYRLAVDLEDLKHKSLYFRLAKVEKRGLLEKARDFAIDYPLNNQNGSSRGKIFMWALQELKKYGKIPKVMGV